MPRAFLSRPRRSFLDASAGVNKAAARVRPPSTTTGRGCGAGRITAPVSSGPGDRTNDGSEEGPNTADVRADGDAVPVGALTTAAISLQGGLPDVAGPGGGGRSQGAGEAWGRSGEVWQAAFSGGAGTVGLAHSHSSVFRDFLFLLLSICASCDRAAGRYLCIT